MFHVFWNRRRQRRIGNPSYVVRQLSTLSSRPSTLDSSQGLDNKPWFAAMGSIPPQHSGF